jgi:hypothetical protein
LEDRVGGKVLEMAENKINKNMDLNVQTENECK